MAVRAVQGFFVANFSQKENVIKVLLKGDKDDVRAGDGDIANILESLELHATASDSSTISLTLMNSLDLSQGSTPYEFIVSNFAVSQDEIKIVISGSIGDDGLQQGVIKSLSIHTSGGPDRPVELLMQRPD